MGGWYALSETQKAGMQMNCHGGSVARLVAVKCSLSVQVAVASTGSERVIPPCLSPHIVMVMASECLHRWSMQLLSSTRYRNVRLTEFKI